MERTCEQRIKARAEEFELEREQYRAEIAALREELDAQGEKLAALVEAIRDAHREGFLHGISAAQRMIEKMDRRDDGAWNKSSAQAAVRAARDTYVDAS